MLKLIARYPLFITVLFITFLINHLRNKTDRQSEEQTKSFWENESKANSTRKKDINNLDYITINEKNLPFIETNDELLNKYQNEILSMRDLKILNLTGYSNTDLKLKYGAANLMTLSSYDENYTRLCRLLDKWANRLIELDNTDDAVTVLEFSVSTLSDISNTYKTLANIYIERNQSEKINDLIDKASQINSLSGQVIVNHLKSLSDSAMR